MSIFVARWLYCDYVYLFVMLSYCFFDLTLSFFFFKLVFYSPLSLPCILSVKRLCRAWWWASPSFSVTEWFAVDWQAGPETLEQHCSSHCSLQMSASPGCGNWWLNNVVYTYRELTIPDRTVCFSFDAVFWEYVQSFSGPMPSTLLFPLIFQPLTHRQCL